MDEPVTDITFVSSKENCPEGYKIIESCLCGHEAQLWEKVLGGNTGERYLCFTKEEKDDMVIEDMYIPSRSAQYLYKGYKIVKETVEGDEPMYHKQLAVKKVPRTHASKVVADIIICRSRDNVSKMYKKLDKVNGLCICFRQDDIGGRNTPSPKHTRRATLAPSTSSAPALRQQRSGSLKIGDASKHMAGVTLNDQGPPSFRRGSGIPLRRSVSPLASHSQASPSHSPLPSSSPPHGEVATIPATPPLTSSPPPPDGNLPSAPPPTNTHYPPPISTAPSSNTAHYSNYPPGATANPYSTQYAPQPYPPPPSSATYPPPAPSGVPYQATYPPPPSSGYGPPIGGGLGFGGLGGAPSGGYSSYPPPPGGSYGGYGAIAGSSFAAAPTAPGGQTGGPAPYNPYQSQQGHAPYPPPGSQQPPPAAPGPSYGFNF